MSEPGIIRRTYDLLALIALIHALVILALIGYAVSTRVLTAESIRTVVAALRWPSAELSSAAGSEVEPGDERAAARGAPNLPRADSDIQMEMEILYREAERVKVELDQRLALNQSILLKVKQERAAFSAEREAAARRDEEARRQVQDVGFEKQVAIFESLSPKVAVQHLMALNDPDDAARILLALDVDRSGKIVEAARRGPELAQMQVIVQRMREAAPRPAPDKLTVNAPN